MPNLLIRMLQALQSRLDVRTARAALRAMTRERLDDLGITCSEIDDFLAGRIAGAGARTKCCAFR